MFKAACIAVGCVVLGLGADARAAERTVAPTYLHRYVPDLPKGDSDITTPTCHYKPIFGEGDSERRVLHGVARFGEVTVDAGGVCKLVTYPAEEQIYVITEGAGMIHYGDGKHRAGKDDYAYLPPAVSHGVSNPSSAPLKLFVMGWKIPRDMKVQLPARIQMANINDVPLQVVGNHPPSTKFRLLMGTTESSRDRIAAAHLMTSLFIMEFEPGGTNFPHSHPTEEEFYVLLSGQGDMVAGGGMDGTIGRHPAKPGDAYFFRINCTVGFFASEDPAAPKARILAARSTATRRLPFK